VNHTETFEFYLKYTCSPSALCQFYHHQHCSFTGLHDSPGCFLCFHSWSLYITVYTAGKKSGTSAQLSRSVNSVSLMTLEPPCSSF
jgi:hypothetical protein